MTMTRQHFALIAAALHTTMPEQRYASHYEQWDVTVKEMAAALRTTNPSFNRDRFLRACGVDA